MFTGDDSDGFWNIITDMFSDASEEEKKQTTKVLRF